MDMSKRAHIRTQEQPSSTQQKHRICTDRNKRPESELGWSSEIIGQLGVAACTSQHNSITGFFFVSGLVSRPPGDSIISMRPLTFKTGCQGRHCCHLQGSLRESGQSVGQLVPSPSLSWPPSLSISSCRTLVQDSRKTTGRVGWFGLIGWPRPQNQSMMVVAGLPSELFFDSGSRARFILGGPDPGRMRLGSWSVAGFDGFCKLPAAPRLQ